MVLHDLVEFSTLAYFCTAKMNRQTTMRSPFVKKPSIILVDDHVIFRQGLKSLITVENLGKVIGEASNGAEFIEKLAFETPDIVLMDIEMPEMNGFEATREALKRYPELKIIAFTMYDDDEYLHKMKDLGVKGYILKSTGIGEVEQAISDVMLGKTYISELSRKNHDKAGKNSDGSPSKSNWWW